MIKVLDFEPAHFDLIEWKDGERDLYSNLRREDFLWFHEEGVCFTAVADGRVILVGGVLQTTPYSGVCATLVSKYAGNHALGLVRTTRRMLESIMETMGLHRVETSNIASQKEHHAWCKALGFEPEGEMPYYDEQKRTYFRFGKYREA